MTRFVRSQEILPDWRDIAVPWEPQSIAWRFDSHRRRAEALRREVAIHVSHIVREVLLAPEETAPENMTRSLAEDLLGRTDTELAYLRNCGAHVAQPEWHIFADNNDFVRALARVPIIRGEEPEWEHKNGHVIVAQNQTAGQTWERSVDTYMNLQEPGTRLCDVARIDQYMYGVPAPNHAAGNTQSQNPDLWLAHIPGEVLVSAAAFCKLGEALCK